MMDTAASEHIRAGGAPRPGSAGGTQRKRGRSHEARRGKPLRERTQRSHDQGRAPRSLRPDCGPKRTWHFPQAPAKDLRGALGPSVLPWRCLVRMSGLLQAPHGHKLISSKRPESATSLAREARPGHTPARSQTV